MDLATSDVSVIKSEPVIVPERENPINHCETISPCGVVKQETEDASAIKFEMVNLVAEEHAQECGEHSEIHLDYPGIKKERFVHQEKMDQSRDFVSMISSINDTKDPPSKQHVTAKKLFACPTCTYSCKLKTNLVVHIRTHTGEKPFSCSECTERFRQKKDLVFHTRIHTGEKPFSCPKCTYRCSQKSSLVYHIRTHTGEKPFSCLKCNYRCSQKGTLVSHTRTHTGERPFACSECSFTCSRKDNMDVHVRTHT